MKTLYSPGEGGQPRQFDITDPDSKHFARQIYREIFELGQYDRPPCVPAHGDIVLDIGANIGAFTAWALERGAVVYAVEPEQSNYNCLLLNAPAAVSYHAAMCGEVGSISLWHTGHEGGHTLHDMCRGDVPEQVPAISLPWFLDRVRRDIDLLKCDCEGGEYEIFNGLPDAYLRRVNRIIMEYHHAVLHREHPEFFAGFCGTLKRLYAQVEIVPLCPELSIITAWRV